MFTLVLTTEVTSLLVIRRLTSSTGQEKSFDIPIPSITGEHPSANSVVFDEVIVKQRINR